MGIIYLENILGPFDRIPSMSLDLFLLRTERRSGISVRWLPSVESRTAAMLVPRELDRDREFELTFVPENGFEGGGHVLSSVQERKLLRSMAP